MRTFSVGAPLRARLFQLAFFASTGAALLLPLACDDTRGTSRTMEVRSLSVTASSATAAPRARIESPSRDPFAHERPVRVLPAPVAEPEKAIGVLAVATGAGARALVEEGGVTRVVAVGDRVDGARIAAILPGGVRFESGAFVALEARP